MQNTQLEVVSSVNTAESDPWQCSCMLIQALLLLPPPPPLRLMSCCWRYCRNGAGCSVGRHILSIEQSRQIFNIR